VSSLVLVLEAVTSSCCGAPSVSGCPPRGEIRCSACGHRTPTSFRGKPRRSRSLPPWTWPGEILGRSLARRAMEDAATKGRLRP
jgi:hypothetical protein